MANAKFLRGVSRPRAAGLGSIPPAPWVGAVLLLTSFLDPAFAFAQGWQATQVEQTAGNATTQTAELSYDHEKLRIDTEADRSSVIVDLRAAKLTFVDHAQKRHATITLDQLVAMRDRMIRDMRAQLPNLPEAIRNTVKERLAALEDPKGAAPALKASGKKEKVGSFTCERFTWEAADGSGEACISKQPGVDISGFSKAAARLSQRLVELGGGSSATNFAILQLAEHGFPVQTHRKVSLGALEVESTTTITKLAAKTFPATRFVPPPDYASEDFEAMMQRQQQRSPRAAQP